MSEPLDDKYTEDTYNMDSQLSMMKKFGNFWSNVSSVNASKLNTSNVQGLATLDAIVDGMRSIQPGRRRT